MGGFTYSIFYKVSDIVITVLLLILTFFVAWLVKCLLIKLLKAMKVETLLSKSGIKEFIIKTSVRFAGKLAYLVTFLLFLPGVLDRLGIPSISHPITGLMSTFITLIPRLVASDIIIAIGFFVASIIRNLLTTVLRTTKAGELQGKTDTSASENTPLSHIITNMIYVLITLIVMIFAIDQLGTTAIPDPANMVTTTIFNMIPNILTSIIIIIVGMFIAKLVVTLLESLLAGIDADALMEKTTDKPHEKTVVSKLLAGIRNRLTVLIFLARGINMLQLPVFTEIGAAIIGCIPKMISVIVILAIATFSANAFEIFLIQKYPFARASQIGAKAAAYALAFFLCLSQLEITPIIVETTFVLIVAALAVTFVIAFDIGGRNSAASTLEKLEKKLESREER